MIGRTFTYVDSLRRMHLVRVERATPMDGVFVSTIVESMDARAVGSTIVSQANELHDRSLFDLARKETENGSVALRQANEIARARRAELEAKESREWR